MVSYYILYVARCGVLLSVPCEANINFDES